MMGRSQRSQKQSKEKFPAISGGNLETEFPKVSEIDALKTEIHTYKKLFSSVLDIFNHTVLDAIMDSAVSHIVENSQLGFIVFLWRPFQNREDISIKVYKDCEIVDTRFHLETIAPFEPFFRDHPTPISLAELRARMNNHEAVDALLPVNPELVMPVQSPSGLYGLILIGEKEQGAQSEAFSSTKLAFLKQLMAFVSLAIQNHLNYDHSLRDGKTGLYNHSFFMTRLNEEISRIKRNSFASSVVVIDVDSFKRFNDHYGHMAGDRVLEHIAAIIKQSVRLEDVPSRFGGEEFTVLLPNTCADSAWFVAERLRVSIANLHVQWESNLPQVTISLGIFTFDESYDLTASEIISRADSALYESKRRGKNRTTMWKPGLQFPQK
ncbi:MAG: GGDEF domain-containing protein [Treponema sp.]|jgi:diguanylate cyclase (GGDEF)-like protein|nr:GGDEF domain-containing protein [Treponema sp.]